MILQPDDGQWLDFYALLEVPVDADEDVIRKRIGKLYAEAAANSDHRDLTRRMYFQSLVERVLPQCRRVLLDPEWRAKYDRQHFLNSVDDPTAQSYVSFVASMRGGQATVTGEEVLPQRIQEEMEMAQRVLDTARSGTELELIPAQAVSKATEKEVPAESPTQKSAPSINEEKAIPSVTRRRTENTSATFKATQETPVHKPVAPAYVETVHQAGEPVRAQVISAEEAADIRRQRALSGDASVVLPGARRNHLKAKTANGKQPRSRVVVGETKNGRKRLISPTSLNLLVAITGVLLTIVIQDAAIQPAVATNTARTPLYVAAAPEMVPALQSIEAQWENTPEGSAFDVVVQPVEGKNAISRALGQTGTVPDVWVPTNGLMTERYNAVAPRLKRTVVNAEVSVAQTPLVLVARSDRAATLRRLFPNRQISSWNALKQAVNSAAPGRFGLANPTRSVSGSLARVSMAREWADKQGIRVADAVNRPAFWQWMGGFEENTPANITSSGAAIKDMVLGTTGRFWWVVGYESEALDAMNGGAKLELYYLPRTALADHPICALDRTGAPVEVARGRSQFVDFLRSSEAQKTFLREGFRPTEIATKTQVAGNPFNNKANRARGVRIEGLPRDENLSATAIQKLESAWAKRFG